eukprot:TRINITY_DN18612_c0_g1_i1.p1 TRINITY_DN18612_c0_g1~~TRINITY_DN18612_c0_g1_i1.p1  ORF type:complete len:722 (+),score=118.48 TRINITY_DN18612_c0_g1_i1:157-2322(+)
MRLIAVLLLFLFPTGVEGAGGVSIFALGSLIEEKAWDVLLMYYVVFGVTMFLETVVHTLHIKVRSSSGTAVIHHITEEVMILGGISAVLVVFENLGGATTIDAPLFHYVHFVIFCMALMFITLVTSLFVTVGPSWKQWTKYENQVTEIENDPTMTDEDRSAFIDQYTRKVKHGYRMLACLCYFRQNLPANMHGVSFSRYMKKMQRKFMLRFLDLTVLSWVMLGVLCLLAAITDFITIQISDNPLATIGLWVLIVGFGPLLVLIILCAKVRHEMHEFCTGVQEMRQEGAQRPPKEQSEFFWRGHPGFSIKLIQTMLLYQVFYLATTVVNFTYRLWTHGAEDESHGRATLLICLCFAPSAIVFFVVLPVILPTLTILASLGEYIDHEVIIGMLQVDKKSGKSRRIFLRDKKIKKLAAAMRVFRETRILSKPNVISGHEEGRAAEEAAKTTDPAFRLFKNDDGINREKPVEITEEDLHATCCECNVGAAKIKCNRCGVLCDECDNNYHRLRLLKNHHRKLFEERYQEDSFDDSETDISERIPDCGSVASSDLSSSVSSISSSMKRKLKKPPLPMKPPKPVDPPQVHLQQQIRPVYQPRPEAPMPPQVRRYSDSSVGGGDGFGRNHSPPGSPPFVPARDPSSPSNPLVALADRMNIRTNWTCTTCRMQNFGGRVVCARCSQPKPNTAASTSSPSLTSSSPPSVVPPMRRVLSLGKSTPSSYYQLQ